MALSYCWGSGVRDHQIILNGQIVAVTETLESALRSVRGGWGSLRLWADALCINQADIDERGREVRRMRQIYGNPAGVFVHLGPEADNSGLAMQLIQKITQSMREGFDIAKYVLQVAVEVTEGGPAVDRDGLIAIYKLICRPYFSRMWIIQELAMGDQQVTIGVGDHGLDLSDIRQALKFMVLNQESFNLIIPLDILAKYATAYQSTIQILWSSTRLRELALASPDRDFTFADLCHPLLRLVQYAEATDSRDKVYGAMSLMPAKLASRVDRQDNNYKLTTEDVFMNFTKSIIENTNDLDIIWNISYQQKSLSTLGLPSWAPDWTLRPGRSASTGSAQEWYFGEDERYAAFDKSYTLPTTWLRDPSRADGGRQPHFHFSAQDTLLHCQGFEVATISGMASEIEVLACVSADPKLMVQAKVVDSPYGGEEETTQALLRTLLLNASGTASENSVIFKVPWFGDDTVPDGHYSDEDNNKIIEMTKRGWDPRLFGGSLSTLDIFRHQISQFVVGGRPFRSYFPTDVIPCPENASLLEFSIMISNVVGRRLVVMETGHIGLAPATVVPGDKVYLIVGSGMPVVLREAAEGFEVVGECYVDGFMKGEGMERVSSGKSEFRGIILC